MEKRIGIIGAGRLGSTLAAALRGKGVTVSGISCKDYDESVAVAEHTGVHAFEDNYELVQNSDVVFLTVPDALIIPVAEDLLSRDSGKKKIMLHCSGAMSGFALPFSQEVIRGSFHPLQSFAGVGAGFTGIYIAMDGDTDAIAFMRQLCEVLGAKPLAIPPCDRPCYHAAAVFASNYLLTILATAESLFANWTDSEEEAREALMPLVRGTLDNFVRLGGQKALTGPIARGDKSTLQKHLSALPEEYLDLYKQIGLFTLALAEKNKNLTDEQVVQMKHILKGE